MIKEIELRLNIFYPLSIDLSGYEYLEFLFIIAYGFPVLI